MANLGDSNADRRQPIARPGMTLGTYRIERLLGRGGMGTVFLAYDMTLHRSVALKVVDAPADDETSRGRVLREARNVAALNHPHICTIHEVGHASGATFIAMEHIDGRSLRDRLDEGGALALADALRYGLQAADALAYAHEHGVVHRDFKAANAMITGDGRLKIVDFGLARRADALLAGETTMASVVPAGVAAGTPYAMAPEQVRGDPADARTDIWALGVLLYEMVTGAQPFTAATVPELFSSILRDPPRPWPDGVAVAIKPVIERCLEKEPARRYQHAGEVRAALDAIQSGLVPPWTAWRYHLTRRPWQAAAASLLIVAAVAVGFNVGGVRDRLLGAPPVAPPIKLAVLPFENLTGDPEQEYFAAGLTDQMITELGRLHPQRLSVIARTSSMRYQTRETPIDQIGRELGVDYVLEGSARREGSRVAISARLIQVHDQTQRWADGYDRELAGILTLQHDVARAVAGSLALALLPEEQMRLAAARPVNPAAYEAYLRGLSHLEKLTRADHDTALQYFEAALEKDPNSALAHTGISLVWTSRQQMGLVRPQVAAPALKAAAARALELDEAIPEAHFVLALARTWTDWSWQAAESSFRRAIDLNPSHALARAFYAHYLHIVRRPDEAIAQMARAVELDPFNPLVQALHGRSLLMAGRTDEALVQARSALSTAPGSPVALGGVANALHRTARYEEALAAERMLWQARGDRALDEALAMGFKEGGIQSALRRGAETLAARSVGAPVAPMAVVRLYLLAGERDQALDWLERAYEAHDPNLPYIGAARQEFEIVRDHPRFQALLRKMNLPQ